MWKSDTRFPNLHISRFPHSKAPSMSFLDRFKIQPKYKSTDPDVRLAAVREYGEGPVTDEDRVAIAALAREDADPRVRRAAAGRIDDVEVLAAIASGDADEGIRGEVLERLAGMAGSCPAGGAGGPPRSGPGGQEHNCTPPQTAPRGTHP